MVPTTYCRNGLPRLKIHSEVIHECDFGDSWRHSIVFEKTVRSNAFEATYPDGRGGRPPEDVGGAGGYARYLRIMADDLDPEHESMKIWVEKAG
ncbi:MAG: Plasmid pRiA4b ORF-3-like protein [Firmicutes bacterium ADurb.BinA052]|nr:MAG: Plasmid pRiA4b ORF-3-like protein [Firmicutes bacterium ADurb.BinA052]